MGFKNFLNIGIYRKFKSPREFAIFKGYGVKILLDGESEWQKGTIGDVAKNAVCIMSERGNENIDFSRIRKAKLDDP